ncbi:PKD domain-containing protein [Arthrobacter alpinus]|nr:PKD domain-containing protein [Arthrobacter alpinus]
MGQPGIMPGTFAASLNGSTSRITSSKIVSNPQTFSLETWIKTTSTSGGRILGFGNSSTLTSSSFDRMLYLRNDGKVNFGIRTSSATSVATSTSALNDGTWHHVVATFKAGVQILYVDGVKQGTASPGAAQAYNGYWRVGTDASLSQWPGAPTASVISGTVDEVAIYPAALSQADVNWHYNLGLSNSAPTAQITSTCTDLDCAFDGSGSADSDGTIASYAWDLGDGTTATGVSPQHTFAPGTYTVTLVVTDNRGATGTATKSVSVLAANQLPTALFTVECTDSSCAFDGSGSNDPDGTIASYAWEFGDGATGTGKTVSHDFAAGAGTYSAKLTVSDNRGGIGTVTSSVVTHAPNELPTAAFTVQCTDRQCAVDASGSNDQDGTISSYAWDFGDGQTGTGETAQHLYAADGTYTVGLTVTDNRGGTGATTQPVSVVLTIPPGTVVAKDDFGRTLAKGLGNADVGGAWTVAGSVSRYAVSPSAGQWIMQSPGNAPTAMLNSVQATDTDMSLNINLDKAATGGGIYVALTGRSVAGAGDYRAKVRYVAAGTVYLAIVRTNSAGAKRT